MNELTLRLPTSTTGVCLALTSLPWPADHNDVPQAVGVASQAVNLFHPSHGDSSLNEPYTRPRLRRHLLLCASDKGLPAEIEVRGIAPVNEPGPHFSQVTIRTLKENLDKKGYVYRECEARLSLAGSEFGLRMGLLPSIRHFSWWQWCRAERLWSGPLAEAWRIGGHIPSYGIRTKGHWVNRGLQDLGERLARECGDILHGDLYLIVWKSGCLHVTAHFKAAYFHYWPKPIPAFPVLLVDGLKGRFRHRAVAGARLVIGGGAGDCLDFAPCGLMFAGGHAGRVVPCADGLLIQPWSDLRVLAGKSKKNRLHCLEPARRDVIPAGVNRTFVFNIGLNGASSKVARYHVPSSWYQTCGVIETDRPGPAAEMAARSLKLIREHTLKGGFDTGRVWRYLRRDIRTGIPQEDGAEWEGNLAQAMFTLAYQRGESPAENWELYLHHAYHAADVAVYHGSWMGRLECTTVMTAPLPKFRFGGMLYGYLETGDPYLFEVARSMAGVYMAMEWALQPRACMGRDAYPLACLMSLWDYTAEPLYLDFARQTALRLLATQSEDGGFSGQAGAGVLGGASCLPAAESISFGSGLLAPIALLEWASRDSRWPSDFKARLKKWTDLMLRLQPADGVWLNGGSKGAPYPLIGSGALFSLVKAGQILHDCRCREAVRKYLSSMNARRECVNGTHSFLSALYAHVADGA
ncbi:MAG: hypothetical protein HY360_04435 [Verrucomicrobia bacterium]|nr:hypothetical protein [Verrucomicrobiota bacterium]